MTVLLMPYAWPTLACRKQCTMRGSNEPLGAGANLHSAPVPDPKDVELDAILNGASPIDAEFESVEPEPEESTPPQATSVSIEANEATEVAANALISMYCQLNGGEPDMALTGSVRIVIYERAQLLAGKGTDFKRAIDTLRALDDLFSVQET